MVIGTPMVQKRPLWLPALITTLLAGGLVIPGVPANTWAAAPGQPVVVRLYVKDREHLNAVAGQLDIWETHPESGYVVAAVTPNQYRWLEGLDYRQEIDVARSASLDPQAPLDPRFYYFDDHYTNANDRYVVDFLQQTESTYTNLTELMDIGNAWLAGQQGEHHRDVWVLRVTNEDPAYGPIDEKPAFFLMAAIHAREAVAPELAIRYIEVLTGGYEGQGGYGTDADVTWLVNHSVAYVLVMQNPDGYAVNEQNAGASRRKNLDWDDGCSLPSSWGVDLNRNHSFLWGCCGGSSSDPCSYNYRGPAGASEAETLAFQSFFTSVMEDQNGANRDDAVPAAAPAGTSGIFVSLHSYGDLVLWPWGFEGHGTSPNHEQLRTIGRKFAYYTGYDPSGSIWYAVDGATDDWTYGKFGIASYTFEVGPSEGACSGFMPPYDCVDGHSGRDFWAENRPAFLYAHKIARTPYITAYGPDTGDVAATPARASPGTAVTLTATIADQRYGADLPQPIAAAEYFLDAPGVDGTGVAMLPGDGTWGGVSEDVETVVDTTLVPLGVHYLLVHGRNGSGDWGPFSAVFLTVTGPRTFIHLPVVVRGTGT
jgi:carboxypeptidase T